MAPKPKKKTARSQAVEDAHAFDDKITRRLPIQDLSIPLNPDSSEPVGVVLGTHPLGAIIRNLHAGSRAEQAGLKLGDVLVSICGSTFSTCHEAAALIVAAKTSLSGAEPPHYRPIGTTWQADDDKPPSEGSVQLTLDLTYYKAAAAEGVILKKRSLPKLLAVDLQSAAQGRSLPQKGLVFGASLVPHPLGVSCEAIEKDTLAQSVGLKAGDVLNTIAGRTILDAKHATAILNASLNVGKVTIPADGTTGSNWWQGGKNEYQQQLPEGQPLRLSYYPSKAAAVELVLINSLFLGSSTDDERAMRAQSSRSNEASPSGSFPPAHRAVAFGDEANAAAGTGTSATLDGVFAQPISPALRRARNSQGRIGSTSPEPSPSKRPGGGTGFSLNELEEAEQRDVDSLQEIAALTIVKT